MLLQSSTQRISQHTDVWETHLNRAVLHRAWQRYTCIGIKQATTQLCFTRLMQVRYCLEGSGSLAIVAAATAELNAVDA